MNKPLDNEPTPIVDGIINDAGTPNAKAIYIRHARNLERRMRAAERLLVEVIESDPFWASISYKDLEDATRAKDEVIAKQAKAIQRILAHLEAARKEDGR